MANQDRATFDIGHPAPARGRISLWSLFFGLLAAPLAWTVQLLAMSSIAGFACIAGDGPGLLPPDAAWANPALIAINLAALVVAAIAIAVSYRTWRLAGEEAADTRGGVMEAGGGRSAFLSVWGIWTGVLFLLAIAFNTVSVFWIGLCPV